MSDNETPAVRQDTSDATRAELRTVLALVRDAQYQLSQIRLRNELHPRYTVGVIQMLNLVRWDLIQLIDQRRYKRDAADDGPAFLEGME